MFELPDIKDDIRMGLLPNLKKNAHTGKVVARRLAWSLDNSVLPKPDPTDQMLVLMGAMKRFCFKPPGVTDEDQKLYMEFCQMTWEKEFKPLVPGEFCTFDDWLEASNYGGKRKEQISESFVRFREKYYMTPVKSNMENGSFVKDEPYEEMKVPRWINGRVDEAKSFLGPILKPVNDAFADHPWCIKHVPVEDRARVIFDRLGGRFTKIFGTDYTSFEAHFVAWLMEIEAEFYRFMLQNHPDFEVFIAFLGWLTGAGKINECKMKGWGVMWLTATRMSGEVTTSLGNGFHNMMMIRFLAWLKKVEVAGYVEGDDGVAGYSDPTKAPTTEDFERFGWKIKIIEYDTVGDASFCGNVFSPDELIVTTDPIRVLSQLGWAGKRYAGASENYLLGILRCKALSYYHEYKACPIVSAACWRIIQLTADVKVSKTYIDSLDGYYRDETRRFLGLSLVWQDVSESSRALVERLYGLTRDTQLELEAYFSSCDLGRHEIPDELVPKLWRTTAQTMVCDTTSPFVMVDWDNQRKWIEQIECTTLLRPELGKLNSDLQRLLCSGGIQPSRL